MGSLKNITVLFLHSNKLECLPEEMGDMQKLKVINLSDNKYVTQYASHHTICKKSPAGFYII